jgi:segregation and condensation protein B
MDKEQKIFYSALFLSGTPLDKKFFRKIFDPINLENRLIGYVEAFNNLELGLNIRMVSGGYQMVSDKELLNELDPYFGEKTETLSRASLETVSIIAYKQPITRIEIDEIRGVNSSGTIRYLLDKNLVKVTGRKDVPGRPLLYSTTKFFLEYMGINDISELPTFREWQELKTQQ